ncbi:NicO-domain-containing protein, partial [Lepidopterella palustris CBS 459.81]
MADPSSSFPNELAEARKTILSLIRSVSTKAAAYHVRVPALISAAVLSYTLGLRHALDADHVSVSDRPHDAAAHSFWTASSDSGDVLLTRIFNVTSLFASPNDKFHPTSQSTNKNIVVITSLIVAASASTISHHISSFSHVGSIIGTSISAFFLLLGLMNLCILYKLLRQMNLLLSSPTPTSSSSSTLKMHGGGCLFRLFRRMFKLIDRPWKMYPLGVLFGLGFDTSSEIVLLGISSIQAAKGTSTWLILLFPVLFTAGMCLLDTTDGLMMGLYTSSELAHDLVAVLYYSIVLTVVTVVVAGTIGCVQVLALVVVVAEPNGAFWRGVERVGERWDIVGGAICGSFVLFGGLSVLLYKPWRRRVDRRRARRAQISCVTEGADAEVSVGGTEGR